MHEKQKHLLMIMQYSFAQNEWTLYLDTHPLDKGALIVHKDITEKLKNLEKEYEEKYGPITVDSASSKEKWEWIDEPWPIC